MANWAGFTCEAIWALRDAVELSELEWKVGVGLVSLAVVDEGAANTAHVQGKSLARIAQASRCNRQRALDGIRRLAGETDCRLTVAINPQSSALGDKAPHEYVIVVTPRGGVAPEDHGVAPGASHEQHLGPVEQQGVAVEDQGCCSRGPSYEDPSLRISGEDDLSAHADASAPTAPLALTVQGPKPRGRGNGRPKGQRASSKVQAEDDPPESPHRLLRAHYDTEHERLRGAGPVFPRTKESRVGKAWKEILEVVDLDTARAVVTRALTDGYHVEPWQIADNVNRYRGPAPARPNGQRRHQPNAPEVPDYLRPKEPAA